MIPCVHNSRAPQLLIFKYLIILETLYGIFCVSENHVDITSPYFHSVSLAEGRYQLDWFVDFSHRRVSFNVTVATIGYIGFGLARRGKMVGSDIIIGGVDPDGNSYFSDRHAVGNQLPEIDKTQDWTLHEAWERGGETFLSFSRPFDTCDQTQDIPITNDAITLIWAYSEVDDEVRYHYQNRGGYDTYLLDPDLTPNPKISLESTGVQVFRMSTQIRLPSRDTLYYCTFHKAPIFSKSHIIGFKVTFPTPRDRSYVHHILVHRCKSSAEGILDESARKGGKECYPITQNNLQDNLALSHCSDVIHAWAIGGRTVFFPDHVGIPMSSGEYFMLQSHYDNPHSIPNINVSFTLEAFYTSHLRDFDVSLLEIGTGRSVGSYASLIIPPNSLDHKILVHCAGGCTQRIFKEGGIQVFAGIMHTHMSGRKVRLMQIRRSADKLVELPWIFYDENYKVGFQQVRVFKEESKIHPADQLILSCEYDTTGRNATVAVGGLSARDEMCVALLYYYHPSRPKSPPQYHLCTSEMLAGDYWNRLRLKLQNVTWDKHRFQIVVNDPVNQKTVKFSEHVSKQIRWGLQMREQVQWDHLNLPQVTLCPKQQNNFEDFEANLRVSRDITTGFGRQLRRFSGKNLPEFRDNFKNNFISGLQGSRFLQGDEFVSESPRKSIRYQRPSQCTVGQSQKDIRGRGLSALNNNYQFE